MKLLSKMVNELILDNDQVGLPGLGTFVAEVVPASFSDKGYTINPPYRRLMFHPDCLEEDLLADMYSKNNSVDIDTAKTYLEGFLSDVRTALKDRRSVTFPGMGRLRLTRDGAVFFVPNEGMSIYPEGDWLEPVSLKTHRETDEEVQVAIHELQEEIGSLRRPDPVPVAAFESEPSEPEAPASATSEPVVEPLPVAAPAAESKEPETPASATSEPVVEPLPVAAPAAESKEPEAPAPAEAEHSEPAAAPVTPPARHRKPFRWWVVPVILLLVAIVALAAFLVLAKVAPDFIDSILYTPEELRIINYRC